MTTVVYEQGRDRNGTFLSYLVPLFQNESSCKLFHMKMSLIWMKVNLWMEQKPARKWPIWDQPFLWKGYFYFQGLLHFVSCEKLNELNLLAKQYSFNTRRAPVGCKNICILWTLSQENMWSFPTTDSHPSLVTQIKSNRSSSSYLTGILFALYKAL